MIQGRLRKRQIQRYIVLVQLAARCVPVLVGALRQLLRVDRLDVLALRGQNVRINDHLVDRQVDNLLELFVVLYHALVNHGRDQCRSVRPIDQPQCFQLDVLLGEQLLVELVLVEMREEMRRQGEVVEVLVDVLAEVADFDFVVAQVKHQVMLVIVICFEVHAEK